MKKYCTAQAKMQKWQKDKSQLLAFLAKYHVNLNVQLYTEVCSKESMYWIWKITTITFPLSSQSLTGRCLIFGVVLYLDNLDEQNERNLWFGLYFQIHLG